MTLQQAYSQAVFCKAWELMTEVMTTLELAHRLTHAMHARSFMADVLILRVSEVLPYRQAVAELLQMPQSGPGLCG